MEGGRGSGPKTGGNRNNISPREEEQEPSKSPTGRAFVRYERPVEVVDGEAVSKLGAQ